MSGGVDSSVTALLMQRAGYECVGVTMQLFTPEDEDSTRFLRNGCSSNAAVTNNLRDIEDAKRVCAQLEIEHSTVPFYEMFEAEVIEPFVQAYCGGATPNPCINCNTHLKFGALIEWAQLQGCDCLATGHYAQREEDALLKACDRGKDQSYVLYTLTPEQLAYVRFPLGSYTKEEVRLLAEEAGLPTAAKSESQDICFVPDGDYGGFIETKLRQAGKSVPSPGAIQRKDGVVVGAHAGVHRYTIGQRKGLGIAGPEPLYVLSIDPDASLLCVGTAEERGRSTAYITQTNFLENPEDHEDELFSVKHRYRGKEHRAGILPLGDDVYCVNFLEKQDDLTKGQSLVLYRGDRVVGGGVISDTE